MNAEAAAESKGERERERKGVEQHKHNAMQILRRKADADQFQCFLFKRASLKVVDLSPQMRELSLG